MKEVKPWNSPNKIVHEDHAIRLRQFSSRTGTPTLILPPQAGHDSRIADYADNQSLAISAANNTDGPVYVIDWKSCTRDRGSEGYHDLVQQVLTAITQIGSTVNLVGLCQGGTLATVVTALHPSNVQRLVVAGAPIDVDSAPSILDTARKQPLYYYQWAVMMCGGVMGGELMLYLWKMGNMKLHYVDRFKPENISQQTEKFYDWYDNCQDIAGGWYLHLIENLFKKNLLIKNQFKVQNDVVNLNVIKCPVHLITGTKDDISPPEHTISLGNKVSGDVFYHSINKGHIGVFMSSSGIKNVWEKEVFPKF